MKANTTGIILASVLMFSVLTLSAQQTLTIEAGHKIAPIQPTLWGVFFEDINFALDGGLYAELVKNRSFEFDKPMMGWKEYKNNDTVGNYQVLNRENENPQNPHYIRILKNNKGTYGLINEGFRGMGIKAGITYNLSVMLRQQNGNLTLQAELIKPNGSVVASVAITPDTDNWKKYSVSFLASDTVEMGQLRLIAVGTGVLDIDFVSLFPSDTWKNRPGGLRADLVQTLADLKPGFVRFPGGCVVEGRTLAERYQWKKTLGTPDQRKTMVNRWNMEFSHKLTPDYFQSYGVGFYEYFLLSEDLKAEPLPILSCGMACQYNTAELAQLSDMQPYIQDALDLIEFANGDTNTVYGKIRAKMGHPAPFNMHFIGIGNEQWGTQYIERYKMMAEVVQKAYPDIKIVGSVGPSADGKMFDYLSGEMQKLKPAIVDEHYYMSPDWFLQNTNRYDHYNRNNPKIFVGEFAAQSKSTCSPENKNNWRCAIAEAAYMTGIERNADMVYMASYAPLFGHLNAWQWSPNLIWFDNIYTFPTVNYQVQKLFSTNKGTALISATIDHQPAAGQDGIYVSSSLDENAKQLIVKVVNTNSESRTLKLKINGVKIKGKAISTTTLQCNNLEVENYPGSKSPILPVTSQINSNSDLQFTAYSVTILRFNY